MVALTGGLEARRKSGPQKLAAISWPFIFILVFLAGIGAVALYSAADGSWSPWAVRHLIRFGICLVLLLIIAVIDLRFWLRIAYPLYAMSLALLLVVEFFGQVGMGAQRWIDLGVIQLQPSELAKIGLVLALARYYHGLSVDQARALPFLLPPVAMTLAPAVLIVIQPDLGTALMTVMLAVVVCFLAGARLWWFAAVGGLALAAVPIAWRLMADYQRARVMTFLDPERDPLGAGWNIIQSKIALGSGGLGGKGFLNGTQAHLDFLPEAHTDFVFTLLAEEWGLFGGLAVLLVYAVLFAYGLAIGLRARSLFGRLLALGLMVNLALYVFINIGMVMGLLPVVGVPLPLISYGGTVMLTTMIAFGLQMAVLVHRDARLTRSELLR